MEKADKKAVIKEVEKKLKDAQSVVLADYRGLTVQQITDLRRELRSQSVDFKVYKNTLIKRAIKNKNIDGLNEYLAGPTAVAFGYDDPVAPAKVLSDFAKKYKALSVKGGLLEGGVVDASVIKALAALPSREVLLAKLAGALQAPVSGLANVLNGPMRGLAAALNQVAEQKK